jgi:hypothetical protein
LLGEARVLGRLPQIFLQTGVALLPAANRRHMHAGLSRSFSQRGAFLTSLEDHLNRVLVRWQGHCDASLS